MGVLQFLLFGWLAVVVHSAFSKKCEHCLDCGFERRFRTAGSWVAMLILALMALEALTLLLG